MPFRERLSPRIEIGPLGLGNILGEEIKPGEVFWLETDSDQYDCWSYGVKVTSEDSAEKVLVSGATFVVEVNNTGKDCDFTPSVIADVIERYKGSRINRSSVRGRIRWSSE